MRQIVLDVETTGLHVAKGDRIIEIGLVEIIDRQITGKEVNFYINPERSCSPGAVAIHGLTDEFLSKQRKFQEIINDIINFINGSQLIIHNAPFDLGFLESEFAIQHKQPFSNYYSEVIDTLKYARLRFPGKRSSLDALCSMFQISLAERELHGALLDARLLAKVYLSLTRGQESLEILEKTVEIQNGCEIQKNLKSNSDSGNEILVFCASESELLEHESILNLISSDTASKCIWLS